MPFARLTPSLCFHMMCVHLTTYFTTHRYLGEEGTIYDVMKAIRADEAEHRDVNHAVSGVADDTVNPLFDPREKLDKMLKQYVKDIMAKEASK